MRRFTFEKFIHNLKELLMVIIGFIIVIAIVTGGVYYVKNKMGGNQKPTPTPKATPVPQIVTSARVEKIIKVNTLSTFQAIYNGVSSVDRPDTKKSPDYHVAYEASISIGIDPDKITVDVNNDEKKILVSLPPVRITDTSVDIGSLDFIFENDDINNSDIIQEAYQSCIHDVMTEASTETVIFDLAEKNAENIIRALLEPFLSQIDSEYKLIVTFAEGGEGV